MKYEEFLFKLKDNFLNELYRIHVASELEKVAKVLHVLEIKNVKDTDDYIAICSVFSSEEPLIYYREGVNRNWHPKLILVWTAIKMMEGFALNFKNGKYKDIPELLTSAQFDNLMHTVGTWFCNYKDWHEWFDKMLFDADTKSLYNGCMLIARRE